MVWRESAVLYKVIEEASEWREEEGDSWSHGYLKQKNSRQANTHTHKQSECKNSEIRLCLRNSGNRKKITTVDTE